MTEDAFYLVTSFFNLSTEELERAKAHCAHKVLSQIYFKTGLSDDEEVLYQRAYYDNYGIQIEMYTNRKYPPCIGHSFKTDKVLKEAGNTPIGVKNHEQAINEFNAACELLLYLEKIKKGRNPTSKLVKYSDSKGKSVYARMMQINGETQIFRIKVSNIQRLLMKHFKLNSSNLEFLEYDFDPSVITGSHSKYGEESNYLAEYDSNLLTIYEDKKKVFSHRATSSDFIEACQIIKYMNERFSQTPNIDEFWKVGTDEDEPKSETV